MNDHDEKADSRRPYRSPELFVYGDIRELTQANTPSMMNPDGKGGLFKTG
ncbi:MAG: hypothetical protein AAGD38_18210 [Acidobacteriota bacterium]